MSKKTIPHAVTSALSAPKQPSRVLSTVRQFSEKNPAFPQGSIRNLIFGAKSRKTSKGTIPGNGLDVALVRIGKKVLIDDARFFEWIDALQGGKR